MSKDDIYEGERRISIGPPSGRDNSPQNHVPKKSQKLISLNATTGTE